MTSCWLSALKIYGGLKRGIGISLYEGALTVTICVNLAVKFDRAVYLFCFTKSITIYKLKLKHHSRSFTEVSELYVMLTSRKPVHRTGIQSVHRFERASPHRVNSREWDV